MDFLHIISRSTATARGIRFYFTGAACLNNHFSLRNTKSKECLACHREAQAKIRQRPGFKEKRAAYDRDRWDNDRDYLVEKNRAYYAKNRDQVNEQKRGYRLRNLGHLKAASEAWRQANPDRIRHLNSLRRATIALATPKWADLEKIAAVYAEAERLTGETGILHHVDHVIPLKGEKVCGLHVHINLMPLPWIDNIKKKNKFDVGS